MLRRVSHSAHPSRGARDARAGQAAFRLKSSWMLDVAQVSRILGHASVTTTLNIYTHLFDDARHAVEIRTRRASGPFARLLEPDGEHADNVVAIARRRSCGAARRRRAVERART